MAIQALGSPFEAIQTSWRTRFLQDDRTNVYDLYDEAYIPAAATFPYFVFGRFSGRYEGSTTTSGTDCRCEIRIVDRYKKGYGTRGSVYDLMTAVHEATTNTQLGTTGDWKLWDARPEFDEVLFFEDDTHVYIQGILRYRIRVQFVGDVSTTPVGGGGEGAMATQAGVTMTTQDGTTMETQ